MAEEKDTANDPTGQHIQSKQTSELLDDQIRTQTTPVSYFTLFRYASKLELFGLFVSAGFAIAGGAALPLLTVS
jgi:hypothetical protein